MDAAGLRGYTAGKFSRFDDQQIARKVIQQPLGGVPYQYTLQPGSGKCTRNHNISADPLCDGVHNLARVPGEQVPALRWNIPETKCLLESGLIPGAEPLLGMCRGLLRPGQASMYDVQRAAQRLRYKSSGSKDLVIELSRLSAHVLGINSGQDGRPVVETGLLDQQHRYRTEAQ